MDVFVCRCSLVPEVRVKGPDDNTNESLMLIAYREKERVSS